MSMVYVRKEKREKLWKNGSRSESSFLETRLLPELSCAGVPAYKSKSLQRGSNDGLAGQQNMHGLVDSSDPEMELAETEEVSVSKKDAFVLIIA